MKKLLLLLVLFPFSCLTQINANSKDEAIELSDRGADSIYSNPEYAKNYITSSLNWFENNPVSTEKAQAYQRLAATFVELENYDSASYYYQLSSSTYFSINDLHNAIRTQDSHIMKSLLPSGKYEQALNIALRVNEMTNEFNDPEIRFIANRLLIDVYWDLEEFNQEFLEIALETEDLAYEMGDSSSIETALFFLASAYGRNDKRNLSIEVYSRVAAIQLANEDYHVSATYNNMATQFWHLNLMDSAITYYEKGLKYAYLEGRPDGIAASKLRLGQSYGKLGDFNQSLTLCLEAFEILQSENIVRRQEQCTECIYLSYEELGHKEKAYDYLILDNALRDSLLSRGEEQRLKLVETQFHDQLKSMRDSLAFTFQHELKEKEIQEQKNRSYALWLGLLITVVFAGFAFNRFRVTKRQKSIIESQKSIVETAHEELIEKNNEILDSITYAKRIQLAILPPDKTFKSALANSFVLYKPKDIVAGDFYWLESSSDQLLLAAADCTGHGVPGAMVSVICNNGLNRSVRENQLTDPGAILDKTREIVIQEFEKSQEEVKDGMDIALVSLKNDGDTTLLKYAGAHNPLWIIRKGRKEIEEIKANKQPIGKFDYSEPFQTKEVSLQKGDTFYIFTDGFSDQFGGDKGKKLKASNFKKLILSCQDIPIQAQKEHLDIAFEEWKGSLEQLDDVCVIGVRL